eukprot:m.129042 g.129042  ORF g.129042 m.129042 type:complete len:51 (-) comp15688_c2_seq4:413-565(-)
MLCRVCLNAIGAVTAPSPLITVEASEDGLAWLLRHIHPLPFFDVVVVEIL